MLTFGSEWRPSLKPVIKSPFPFGGFGRLEPNPDEDGSAGIETPRPDITIGIRTAVLVQELRKQGLYHAAARDLLKNLQERAGYRDDRNQWQPALISEPTQRSLNVRFPFLVVEAKSQATGGTMFVAENQAAVSGACALGMQRRLNKLVLESDEENDSYADRKHPPPRPEDQGNTPLAFSISTQGVLHELWAHYTVATDGDPEVHMMMVGGCVPANLQDICRWLAIVDNVMAWGTGQFLRSVVERLMSLTTSAATAVTAATEKPRVPTGRGRPRS